MGGEVGFEGRERFCVSGEESGVSGAGGEENRGRRGCGAGEKAGGGRMGDCRDIERVARARW